MRDCTSAGILCSYTSRTYTTSTADLHTGLVVLPRPRSISTLPIPRYVPEPPILTRYQTFRRTPKKDRIKVVAKGRDECRTSMKRGGTYRCWNTSILVLTAAPARSFRSTHITTGHIGVFGVHQRRGEWQKVDGRGRLALCCSLSLYNIPKWMRFRRTIENRVKDRRTIENIRAPKSTFQQRSNARSWKLE